jgi:hypothetical protein
MKLDKLQMKIWYEDPVEFFKDIFRNRIKEPYNYQKKILREFKKYNRIMISAASDTGKTLLLACIGLWSASILSVFINKRYDVIIISGSQDQAKYLYEYMREGIIDSNILSKLVEGEPLISLTRFKNRSTIRALSKSYTSIAGKHADMVIIDEAAFSELDFYIRDALRIISPSKYSKIILSSSPHEYESLFVKMWLNKEKYPDNIWKRYHWEAYECPRTRKKLKEAESLPEDMYIKYYKGLPFIIEDIMIPLKSIKESLIDGIIPYNEKNPIYIGYDPGYNHPTGIVIVQYNNGIFEVLETKLFKKEIFEKIHDWIEYKARYYKASKIYVDGQDVGEVQRLRARGLPVFPIAFNKEKGYMQSKLRDLFVKKQIKIPNIYQDLIQQLRTYTWKKKINDDLVDALMLACKEEKYSYKPIYYKIIKSRKKIF